MDDGSGWGTAVFAAMMGFLAWTANKWIGLFSRTAGLEFAVKDMQKHNEEFSERYTADQERTDAQLAENHDELTSASAKLDILLTHVLSEPPRKRRKKKRRRNY